MGTRNRQSPRQKRQVYLSAEIAVAFDAAVLASGLSVGQFIDRWWLTNPPTGTPASTTKAPAPVLTAETAAPGERGPALPPSQPETGTPHQWRLSEALKAHYCSICGQPKTGVRTSKWCPGPPK